MTCPRGCGQNLVMAERQGVEIDYCPACRGVWLDRGELDKILERATAIQPPPNPNVPPYGKENRSRPYYDDDDDDYFMDKHGKRRRKHWLMDIFD